MKNWKRYLLIPLMLIATVLFGAESCEEEKRQPQSQKEGQKQTEQAFKQQSTAVPYPADKLKDSLERRNLRERLLRQNDPNKIGYVYFVQFGKFMGYWTIKGKISSTQSQMTTSTLIYYACDDGLSGCQAVTIPAPGDDGSYSENERGVFFFTTEGAQVQIPEDAAVYSDQPLSLNNVPELNGKTP